MDVNTTDTLSSFFEKNVGERVSVELHSGGSIEGKIESAGQFLIHISRISGKEYYDALVNPDGVEAVIFKARSA
ncbi:MAG: LSm family protein [Planctomycetota bacterium]|jgi:hypothetical protein